MATQASRGTYIDSRLPPAHRDYIVKPITVDIVHCSTVLPYVCAQIHAVKLSAAINESIGLSRVIHVGIGRGKKVNPTVAVEVSKF